MVGYDKRTPCMTATTGFSVQTQLSQVLHLSHGGAVAVQLRQLEESPHGLSQRRVPPVGPSDYQIHCHSAQGRPHVNLSSLEVGRDGELMQYIG